MRLPPWCALECGSEARSVVRTSRVVHSTRAWRALGIVRSPVRKPVAKIRSAATPFVSSTRGAARWRGMTFAFGGLTNSVSRYRPTTRVPTLIRREEPFWSPRTAVRTSAPPMPQRSQAIRGSAAIPAIGATLSWDQGVEDMEQSGSSSWLRPRAMVVAGTGSSATQTRRGLTTHWTGALEETV